MLDTPAPYGPIFRTAPIETVTGGGLDCHNVSQLAFLDVPLRADAGLAASGKQVKDALARGAVTVNGRVITGAVVEILGIDRVPYYLDSLLITSL